MTETPQDTTAGPEPAGAEGPPRAAVVIPHYNDPERLVRCLEALVPQAEALGGVEIVVADNASPRALDAVGAAFPAVRVVTEEARGAGPARNRGVAETTAPVLLFIDADCVPGPDWLAVGLGLAEPRTVVGGRVDVFDETPPPRSGAEAFEAVFAFDMAGYLEAKGFLGSGNLVMPRAVFEEVGGFRPAVSEDVDWSRRARAAGIRLVYSEAFAVGHPSRSDWPALQAKWRRVLSEGFQLEAGTAAGRVKWGVKALLMPASVVAHIPRVIGHPDLAPVEKRRALGTLIRLRFYRMIVMLGQVLSGRP